MKRGLVFGLIFLSIFILASFVVKAEVTEADIEASYTQDFLSSDKITFTLLGETQSIKLSSMAEKTVGIKVSQNDKQYLSLEGNNPQERKFDLNYDKYYDLSVKLNSISKNSEEKLIASLTLKKINELIPDEAILKYSCFRGYTCQDGTKIKQCWEIDLTNESVCRCKAVSIDDCLLSENKKNETENDENNNETETEDNETIHKENKTTEDNSEKNKEKQIFKFENRTGQECTEGCTCTGVVMKCNTENGREMTIFAGKSGNIIIQIKGVNMTTNVTLYKENESVYGEFSGSRTKKIILPDKIKEELENQKNIKTNISKMELDKDGFYNIEAKKKAKLFFIFSVNEKIKAQVNSETGQIIDMSSSWWGFLASDTKS
jgi:hypothetical protein